ncbi:hypothetical protein DBR11_17495 [Pedobacter sp. HMWF019]|uniref:hypothetical protein n=1 Tax=Pedobacter sp. HMWF019 TaxID=2056856 RepID=UPI000D3546CE|nr:hypothetical protein [Pedobacter sp. HMWF019]PTS97295.1 hypothetical protein DBR11_17495 [Pedobacter sp. HMWF019]
MKRTIKKMCLVSLSVALVTIAGCKKQSNELTKEEVKKESSVDSLEIESLKIYLSELYHLDIKEISFDPKTGNFIYHDVVQITRERLIEIRNSNKK